MCLASAPLAAYQEGAPPRTNLELQSVLVRALAVEVIDRAGIAAREPLALRISGGGEEEWITRQAFVTALRSSGFDVATGDGGAGHEGRARIELLGPVLSVHYSEPFQDGLFGTARVARDVSARFDCMVEGSPGGSVRLSDAFSRSHRDTVRLDELPVLESASLRSTRGELPHDRFIDRIVEPFIIVGATGVAVFLLFNIRS